MGHSKIHRRKKKQNSLKVTVWLPIAAVGSLLLIGAAVFLFGQKDKNGTASGSTRFDSDFEPKVTGAPRVEVPEDYIDYGDVQLGTTVTTEFEVRNVGDEPLVILGEPQVEVIEGC